MKTGEDVCDECVQLVCLSAQKASTVTDIRAPSHQYTVLNNANIIEHT